MNFNRIKASIRFSSIYKCAICGFQQSGDTCTAEFEVYSPLELAQALENQRQTSHAMPVGWGYDGTFYCGCTRKEAA
jgi:hypothetical protein